MNLQQSCRKEAIYLDQAEVYTHIVQTYDPNGIGLHYPSMYQDLIKNHRLTEIDYINGAVWRKGQKYNVATPFCAMLTQLVHGKEELLELNNKCQRQSLYDDCLWHFYFACAVNFKINNWNSNSLSIWPVFMR